MNKIVQYDRARSDKKSVLGKQSNLFDLGCFVMLDDFGFNNPFYQKGINYRYGISPPVKGGVS